ncbi:MAG: preprotein translocase subunit SecG [Syntrophorhabdaceae bacterium]|nr:preprotein translocase subunit SecG [Syntrophorhabdaceae bacterium]MDD4196885.1 preprotein translocase subunit SecG [Syntrophorhabdaceae bacterium]HOC45977.1 preprotein translocase subunit SecG [Syntrophorhabdaceae bacterium]
MTIVIGIIHVIIAIGLILIVLLQTGRGSDIGAAFGGGSSQTLFGSSGSTGFMTKLTTIAAVVFMVTSLVLAYTYSHKRSAVRSVPAQTQQNVPVPVPQNAPAQGTK